MLTREQLMAMPAEDYMCQAQLDFFKQLLLDRLAETRDRCVELRDQLRGGTAVADIADQASVEEERSKTLIGLNRLEESALKMGAALRLIDDGDYGYCADTGVPITLERLLVAPESTLCIDSQHAREYRNKTSRAA